MSLSYSFKLCKFYKTLECFIPLTGIRGKIGLLFYAVGYQLAHLEHIRLPENLNYVAVHGLSSEAVEKLSRLRPDNLSHASRISGISPADISILMTFLKAGGYHD